MGQKVNPRAFRQTTTFATPSKWYTSKYQYAQWLNDDVSIRRLIKTKLRAASVARIVIERSVGETTITIHTSKPGVVIGRGGALIEELKKQIKREFFGNRKMKVAVNIQEVRDPDVNSEIIAQAVRDQLEARIPFRRAIKRAQEQVQRAGALGCKIQVSGRLNGTDIARREFVAYGRLPLHTLRANIDYSRCIAQTMYGVIGVKVWVYTGDVFGEETAEQVTQEQPKKRAASRRPRQKRASVATTTGGKTTLRKKSDIAKEPVTPSV